MHDDRSKTGAPAVGSTRLVGRRRTVRYHVWTDEDGPMQPHRFAGGRAIQERLQEEAQWFAGALGCYVQLHDKQGRILASAGEMFDATLNAKVRGGAKTP